MRLCLVTAVLIPVTAALCTAAALRSTCARLTCSVRTWMQVKAGAGKATEKEIIIDVPLALKLALNGWAWPLTTITVSGRLPFLCTMQWTFWSFVSPPLGMHCSHVMAQHHPSISCLLVLVQELRNGTLTEKAENITVSPR